MALAGPQAPPDPADHAPAETAAPDTETLAEPLADPLATLGFEVTGGAAPGYIEDRSCALCHNDLWTSYQEVGMARSFAKPREEILIESFGEDGWGETFFHQPSDRYYRMRWKDGRMTFRRWQTDAEGRPVHVFERDVDWILGSGHTSRVYLYQTPAGELYQLPFAWYSQDARGRSGDGSGHWDMAPGFDRPDHLGIQRLVHRECMFCHNAYPDVPAGSDLHGQPHLFPTDLPEGTGCQRCHGPGAAHVRAAFSAGTAQPESEPDTEQLKAALHATIVNPGRLSDELRDDVCFGCHLQPTVAVHGVRRFDRSDYSFRPGEPLSDYLVKMDIEDADRPREERFEINHHAFRLRQSRCFLESRGTAAALSCLTCHDPHRKVPASERVEHYRQACLSCHQLDACRLEEMEAPAGFGEVDSGDCVTCHMPRRRTQDVVQVVMTDHRIQRRAPGPERLEPLAEKDPTLTAIEVLEPEGDLAGALGEVYRTLSLLRTGAGDRAAVRHLAQALDRTRPPSIVPYLDLARAQIRTRDFAAAEATLTRVLATASDSAPESVQALSWMGIAKAGLGKREEALEWSRKALAAHPERAESHFNLGRLLLGYGRAGEALPLLEKALELRPTLAAGWLHLGEALTARDQTSKAEAAYRRTLEIDPENRRARAALGLTEEGDDEPETRARDVVDAP